jgi:amino acid transporter
LLASTLHVTIAPWALFIVILIAAVFVAYLGITTSGSVDLVLVAGEIAVIAALAITILVKIGPAHYSAAVLSPASSPNQRLADLTDAMIYGFTAFAGFEAAAALGEEAKNSRRSVPVSIVGIVVVTGIFYLLVVCAEAFAVGRHGIAGLIGQASPLGYLTSRFWSPSVLWSIDLVIVLAGLSFVVASVNAAIRIMFTMGRERALPGSLGRLSHRRTPVAAIGCLAVIRAFRTEFRDEFRLGRHLLIPAAATVVFLFPLWGILFPGAYTLANLLPFISLGWLLIGAIAAGILRARRPATFQALGRAVAPNLDKQLEPD